MIRERYEKYEEKEAEWSETEEVRALKLKHPPWICQPYVRAPPEEHLKKVEKDRIKQQREKEEDEKVGKVDKGCLLIPLTVGGQGIQCF